MEGQNGELWFRTIGHLDRDKDFLTGINPMLMMHNFMSTSVILRRFRLYQNTPVSVGPALSYSQVMQLIHIANSLSIIIIATVIGSSH